MRAKVPLYWKLNRTFMSSKCIECSSLFDDKNWMLFLRQRTLRLSLLALPANVTAINVSLSGIIKNLIKEDYYVERAVMTFTMGSHIQPIRDLEYIFEKRANNKPLEIILNLKIVEIYKKNCDNVPKHEWKHYGAIE